MKLARAKTRDGTILTGHLDGGRLVEFGTATEPVNDEIVALIQMSATRRQEKLATALSEGRTHDLSDLQLLTPIPSPGKVLAIARGYARPTEPERGANATPYLFLKRSDGVIGPTEPIVLDAPASSVVAEIELAVVIGQPARNVAVPEALDAVGGYTIGNDVSARSLDLPAPGRRDADLDKFMNWINGKWLDTYLALGPSIVTSDEWEDDGNRMLTTRVSGQETVVGNTSRLLHSVSEVVAFASHLMTLSPGDIILTGMPETPKPERHLQPGDVVEGEIDGLGTLSNPIVAADWKRQ